MKGEVPSSQPDTRTPAIDDRIPVLVIPALFPSGADGDIRGIYTIDYAESVAHRCRVSVVVGDFGNVPSRVDDAGSFRVHRRFLSPLWTRLGPIRHLVRLAAVAREALRIKNVRLVHAHGPIFGGVPALAVARFRRIPLVVTVHTGPFSKLMSGRLKRMITRHVMRKAERVLLVSDDLRRQVVAAGITDARLVVTFNPVDTDVFDPISLAAGPRTKTILFVGRLEGYKGCLRLVRAFEKVASQIPDWSLILVGDGPERTAIESLIAENAHLGSHVVLYGAQSKRQIAEIMSRSSLFAFPSEHETFGLVVAEAMACGLPVIVGDNSAPAEFVDSSSGLRIPPLDEGALAEALVDMAVNVDKYDRRSIRETVVKQFGLEAFGAALVEQYEEVLQECVE